MIGETEIAGLVGLVFGIALALAIVLLSGSLERGCERRRGVPV